MRLETALRKVHDNSYRAKQLPRTYSVLASTDEMIKDMAEREKVPASEIVKACVLATYETWSEENKNLISVAKADEAVSEKRQQEESVTPDV